MNKIVPKVITFTTIVRIDLLTLRYMDDFLSGIEIIIVMRFGEDNLLSGVKIRCTNEEFGEKSGLMDEAA